MKQQGICLCSLFVLVTVIYTVSAQGFYPTGGRYGKRTSENNQLFQEDHIARRSSRLWGGRGSGDVQQVAPRAERFFMGSRYGKRAGNEIINGVENDLNEQLSCQYTGVINLYRCINSKERPPEAEGAVQESANN
ncbi:uncharacterized protein LOC142322894 [Lycorma delicatula]|uniref:uncharacterized protein LOC142322894 n=1 Tax=Lycorma delicatula TaxID=130591 RepID=UPI003F510DA4